MELSKTKVIKKDSPEQMENLLGRCAALVKEFDFLFKSDGVSLKDIPAITKVIMKFNAKISLKDIYNDLEKYM